MDKLSYRHRTLLGGYPSYWRIVIGVFIIVESDPDKGVFEVLGTHNAIEVAKFFPSLNATFEKHANKLIELLTDKFLGKELSDSVKEEMRDQVSNWYYNALKYDLDLDKLHELSKSNAFSR